MKRIFMRLQVALLIIYTIVVGTEGELAIASSFDTGVRDSIAVVATSMEIPGQYQELIGWGTGFFVGDPDEEVEYLITNHHVVADFLEYGSGESVNVQLEDGSNVNVKTKVRVYFDSSDYMEAYVVDYNETKDLALLKLFSKTDKRKAIPVCSPSDDMIGSTVYCVGYPGLSDNQIIDASSSWSKTDATVTTGTISRFVTSSGTGVQRIQTDAVIQQGNSGGPMVNGNGSVIGVNSSYITNETETSYYAISIDEVLPILNHNNVVYKSEAEIKKGSGILGNKTALIAIGGIVALFVIVLMIVLLRKNKKQKVQPIPVADTAQAVIQTKQAFVRSMSAQHNGVSFPIGMSPVLIGRDAANCTIVFREGTPGVSGRHCSISWNEASQEFLLTDLRSTYGTFLANGQKLEPNVAYHLKAGESFYVGENTNVLRVEVG